MGRKKVGNETATRFWTNYAIFLHARNEKEYLLLERSNIPRSSIVNSRQRNSLPSIEYIRLLAENLNVKIEDFFQDSEKVLSVPPRKGVPFYDIDVAAHISEVFENEVAPSFWIDFEPFNDCTIYLPIYGESMLPDIQSGDIGAFKLINNINVLLWGEAYLIITGPDANNLRTVKLVFPHEDYSKIILRASNPSFKGDTIIDKAAIISVFMLKGTIKRKQL